MDISERSLDLRALENHKIYLSLSFFNFNMEGTTPTLQGFHEGNLVVPKKDITSENKLKKRKERKRMKMKNSLIFFPRKKYLISENSLYPEQFPGNDTTG